MRPRVLCVADLKACPDVLAPLRARADVDELMLSQQQYDENLPQYDAVLTSLAVQTRQSALSRAQELRVIATATTGLDHIDIEYAAANEIKVLSLKGDVNFLRRVTATAELAWGLLLATVRKIPSAVESAKRGEWDRERFLGSQLSGKTLGVVGYGRLGAMVANYGLTFGMRVLTCDKQPLSTADSIEQVDFRHLLCESDVVSIHVPLNEETQGMFDHSSLAMLKEGAVVINTSRGAVIDETALLDALKSGRLGGVGLDVIDGEWCQDLASHPLIQYARTHSNLIVLPHIGGVTYESQRMAYERIVHVLIECLPSNA